MLTYILYNKQVMFDKFVGMFSLYIELKDLFKILIMITVSYISF